MNFRFHRGGLDESMQTLVEVKSIDELKKVIGGEPEFEYAGYDTRIGWNTFYVSVDGKIIGMSDNNKF